MSDDAKKQIKYEQGGDNYMVQLSAHYDPTTVFGLITGAEITNGFDRIAGHPSLSGKNGEELVSGILALSSHMEAGIYKLERFKNGARSDGPKGEPALIEFGDKGMTINHYKDGKLNDGAAGQPAVQVFKQVKDGYTPAEVKSFKDGVEGAVTGDVKYSIKRVVPSAAPKPADFRP